LKNIDALHTLTAYDIDSNKRVMKSLYFSLAFVARLRLVYDQCGIFASVVHHLEEGSLLLDQLKGGAHFDYSPLLHHDNIVVVGDRIESMGDRDDSCVLELLLDYRLDEVVGLHVHVGSGLIQHNELVSTEQSTCQAQELLLAH
jgi:hypothetical protein